MNKTSVALLASLALFANVAGAAKAGALNEGSNPPAPAPKSIPWSELGTHTDLQQAPQLPVLSQDQATLAAPLRALSATVTPDGLIVDSTSVSEGGGRFQLTPVRLDKGGAPVTLTPGKVSTDGGAVILDRGALREVLTTSAEGVRQDFIVMAPPEGTQHLVLTIDVHGATASQAGDNVALTLPGGRKLTYHGLLVTDAAGRVLEANLKRQDDKTLYITVADTGSSYPLTIDPTITDDDWSALGTGLFGGSVYSLAVDGSGNLYAGGAFTTAGGVTANNVAMWDGSSWSALGSGTNGYVYALVLDGSGTLYAGGSFTSAGGVAANHVAKWDGSEWSALGSGMYPSVRALAVDDTGALYAGGHENVSVWRGVRWGRLGQGGITVNGDVYALAVDRSRNVYVGGHFTLAGGLWSPNLAKVSPGNAWSAFPQGGTGTYVYALAQDSSGNLYVGGSTVASNGTFANLVKWGGSNWCWYCIDMGLTRGAIKALAVDDIGNLYVGGEFHLLGNPGLPNPEFDIPAHYIAKWDGSSWSTLGSGTDDPVQALALDSSGNLYVGGNFTTAGGKSANHVAAVKLPPRPEVAVVLPDQNGDWKSELAVFRDGLTVAEVRDGVTGALLKNITLFGEEFTPIAGTALPDTDGDGKPELAVLATRDSDGRAVAQIHNVGGNSPVRTIWFSAGITPIAVKTIAGDADGNGVPELAVLATRDSDGRGLVEVKNAYGATNPHTIWSASGYTPLTLKAVGDSDGNGVPEVAVLSRRNSDGRIVVEVKNAAGPTNPSAVWFMAGNTPVDLAVVADKDGNGIPEVAVLSKRDSHRRMVVEVKNARGPTNPSSVWFAAGHTGLALEAVGDADGNTVPEIAVLSRRNSDGRILVEVKNATGATDPRSLWYPPDFTAWDLAILNDADSNGIEEAAVLMTRNSDNRILAQRRNAAGNQVPKDYWFSP